MKLVGLIRGDQGGRRVNGKTRGGPWHPIRILITNCLTDCILGNFSACTFPWLCSNIKSNILLQVSLHQHDIFINIGVLEKRTTNAKVSIPGVNPRIPCLWFGCEYSKSHGLHSFSSDADWICKDWHWFSVDCAPAGETTSISLREPDLGYLLWVRMGMLMWEMFVNSRSGVGKKMQSI